MNKRLNFSRRRIIPTVLYLVSLLLVTAGLLAACASRAPSLTVEDRAEIYAAVVRRVTTEDDTFGGNLNPTTVYIIQHTDDRAGDQTAAQGESIRITDDLRQRITDDIGDLSAEIVWVDAQEDVPTESDTGSVSGNGAIITLGNIHPQDDGTVWVAGSIYVGMLAAGGQTYVVEEIDGAWTITGNTGVIWMS
jgi:hypothetical protein